VKKSGTSEQTGKEAVKEERRIMEESARHKGKISGFGNLAECNRKVWGIICNKLNFLAKDWQKFKSTKILGLNPFI
jgi:hypothetical protein